MCPINYQLTGIFKKRGRVCIGGVPSWISLGHIGHIGHGPVFQVDLRGWQWMDLGHALDTNLDTTGTLFRSLLRSEHGLPPLGHLLAGTNWPCAALLANWSRFFNSSISVAYGREERIGPV